MTSTATIEFRRDTGPARPRRRGVSALGILPVAVLAVVSLWFPESPDQSLFAVSARQLRGGAVYYRDIWDIKQPGIYWFYELGELIGPGGIGARVLEAALAVAGAALVLVIVSSWTIRPSVRLAAPIMVMGPYLAYSARAGVGEIEGLMNVLVLAVLASTWPAFGAERLRSRAGWFVAGLVTGVIVLLKTFYLPIPLVLLAGALVAGFRLDRRGTLARAGLAVLGAIVPVAAAVAYLAAHHLLDLALWTSFRAPFDVVSTPALRSASSIAVITQAAKNMFAVVGPLAVAGLIAARRRRQVLLAATLTLTGLAEVALALPQLWTAYRWLMLAAPAGLLAVGGLDVVLGWFARVRATLPRLGLRVVAGLLALGATLILLRPAVSAITDPSGHGLSTAARIARGEDSDPVTHPLASTALMAGRIPAGSSVYVIGDARILALVHAEPAVPVSGLSMHLMPDVVWTELASELNTARPAFIYVGIWDRDAVTRNGSGHAVWSVMKQNYTLAARGQDGDWFQAKDPGPGLPAGYVPFGR